NSSLRSGGLRQRSRRRICRAAAPGTASRSYHLPAHLTILPPRCLQGDELAALELLEEVCSHADPFEITLGEVESFVPVTPTVFIRVAHAGYRMRELHDRLNTRTLEAHEEWPYMPHLTIAKLSTEAQAQEAYRTACDRWAQFSGS